MAEGANVDDSEIAKSSYSIVGAARLCAVGVAVVLASCSTLRPAESVELPLQQPQKASAPANVFKRKIVLHGADFAFDEATLSSSARHILGGEVAELKDDPTLCVRVEGHTDSIGDASYNRRLSEQRALSVKVYLVEQGVAADRITTVGFGEDFPLVGNHSEAGRVSNRRVEVKIIEQ